MAGGPVTRQIRRPWPGLAALALGLLAGGAPEAALEAVEEAHEVELASVELPTHALGQVGFPPCARCARIRLGVDERTRYLLAGSRSAVPLATFREEAAKRSGNRDAVVYVIYDVESRVVTRLVLDGPRR
jgi:hypothetical protein